MCNGEASSRLLQSPVLYGIRTVDVSSGWLTDKSVAVCGSCISFHWRDATKLEIDYEHHERRGWEATASFANNRAVYENFFDDLRDTVRVEAGRVLSGLTAGQQRIESCWYQGKINP